MSTPHQPADLGVLRFITAGSVDDGKSTLIGRLLYDSKAVLRKYLLKQTTNTVFARIGAVQEVLDVHTLSQMKTICDINMNDIGRVVLTLQKPIICDLYDKHPAMGAFVLIDEATHHTVAAGMIRTPSA